MIDWTARNNNWPEPHPFNDMNLFHHISLIGWGSEYAGYSFYTGRKWADQWDTRPSRNRGSELLVTDLTSEWGWGGTGPRPLYFNPHEGRAGTLSPQGTAHRLTADGSVSSYGFADAVDAGHTTTAAGGRYRWKADAEKINISGTESDGPYWEAH